MARQKLAEVDDMQLWLDEDTGEFFLRNSSTQKVYVAPDFINQVEVVAFYLMAAVHKIAPAANVRTTFGLVEE